MRWDDRYVSAMSMYDRISTARPSNQPMSWYVDRSVSVSLSANQWPLIMIPIPQDVEASIADEAKVCSCGNGYARVEEGRVFDAVAIEALSAKLEHGGEEGKRVGRRARDG